MSDNSIGGYFDNNGNFHPTPTGPKAIAEAIRVTASVTSVNLLGNRLDNEAASVLLKVKEQKPMLRTLCGLTHAETKLNYRSKGLGPAGAMLLAPELQVMASVTSVSVTEVHSNLGE